MIHGFDYDLGQPVSRTRSQWRALISEAASIARVGGDLLLKDRRGTITAEVYQWRAPRASHTGEQCAADTRAPKILRGG